MYVLYNVDVSLKRNDIVVGASSTVVELGICMQVVAGSYPTRTEVVSAVVTN